MVSGRAAELAAKSHMVIGTRLVKRRELGGPADVKGTSRSGNHDKDTVLAVLQHPDGSRVARNRDSVLIKMSNLLFDSPGEECSICDSEEARSRTMPWGDQGRDCGRVSF